MWRRIQNIIIHKFQGFTLFCKHFIRLFSKTVRFRNFVKTKKTEAGRSIRIGRLMEIDKLTRRFGRGFIIIQIFWRILAFSKSNLRNSNGTLHGFRYTTRTIFFFSFSFSFYKRFLLLIFLFIIINTITIIWISDYFV